MKNNIKINIISFAMIISAIALLSAYFIQHIMGFAPCPLCIYQRTPYEIILIVGLISITLKRFYRLSLIIILLAIISNIFISAYHSGIERKIFTPLETCELNQDLKNVSSFAQYKELIAKQYIESCSEAPFKMLGLSLAEYNLLINILLLLIILVPLLKQHAKTRIS